MVLILVILWVCLSVICYLLVLQRDRFACKAARCEKWLAEAEANRDHWAKEEAASRELAQQMATKYEDAKREAEAERNLRQEQWLLVWDALKKSRQKPG